MQLTELHAASSQLSQRRAKWQAMTVSNLLARSPEGRAAKKLPG